MAQGRSRLGLAWRRIGLRWVRLTDPVLGGLRAAWHTSLRIRVMTTTGLVAATLVAITGGLILTSIGGDLYSARLDASLQDSARATLAAQRMVDQADTSDRSSLSTLLGSVRRTVQDASASQKVYLKRQAGQPTLVETPPPSTTDPRLVDVVTPELSQALAERSDPQLWQPVVFVDDEGDESAGLVVATWLELPAGAGIYDLYIGYDLADTQATLGFIQRALLVAGALLILIMGALVWLMIRSVFKPVREAADTSRRLAAGEGGARMSRQNDHDFDVLSEGFNEMADTLQSRIRELDELSEMQQRFTSDVSHELRTPLTTIKLVSEVLRASGGRLEPSGQRALEVLGAQIDRFEELLGDLLEISRYDAGRVTLETEQVNLVSLVREVVEGLQPLSPSIIEVRPLGGYSPVEVDARRIRRIVSNLVGNAIEHGEGRPIVVTIDSNASAVAIAVRDLGVGMAAEDVERVFDRFWRADPSRKRTLGGTGLGLSIAREDAAVHGGILEAWSRPGEGANFRLTLPRGDGVTTFMSPLKLVPDDVDVDERDTDSTGGWLRRPGRLIRKRPREDEE